MFVRRALAAGVALGLSWTSASAGAGAPNGAKEPPREVFLYSTRSDNKVHLIDAADLSPIASIDAEVGAHELALSPNGRWAIGSAYGGPGRGHHPPDKRLVVIDAQARKAHRVIDLGVERPNDIAFLPCGVEAVVTVEVPPRLVKVNAETGEFTEIPLEHKAGHMLALSPDGATVYVSHVMPGLVSVVDLATGQVGAVIETPPGAEGIACSPDGSRLWVACNRSETICIIDTATREEVQRFELRGFPFRVKFSPDGATVAVSLPGTASVALFNTADLVDLEMVRVQAPGAGQVHPTNMAFTPDGSALAVVCDGAAPEVVRIDVKTREVTHRIPTAPTPDAMAGGAVAAG